MYIIIGKDLEVRRVSTDEAIARVAEVVFANDLDAGGREVVVVDGASVTHLVNEVCSKTTASRYFKGPDWWPWVLDAIDKLAQAHAKSLYDKMVAARAEYEMHERREFFRLAEQFGFDVVKRKEEVSGE